MLEPEALSDNEVVGVLNKRMASGLVKRDRGEMAMRGKEERTRRW